MCEIYHEDAGAWLRGSGCVGRHIVPLILAGTACAWASSHCLRLHCVLCPCGCLCICERVVAGLSFLAAALGVVIGLVGYVEAEPTFQGGRSVLQCRRVHEQHEREHMAIGTCISWEQPASFAQSICCVMSQVFVLAQVA